MSPSWLIDMSCSIETAGKQYTCRAHSDTIEAAHAKKSRARQHLARHFSAAALQP
jgi:hypothetical protein